MFGVSEGCWVKHRGAAREPHEPFLRGQVEGRFGDAIDDLTGSCAGGIVVALPLSVKSIPLSDSIISFSGDVRPASLP
jgi:hypothetical protein